MLGRQGGGSRNPTRSLHGDVSDPAETEGLKDQISCMGPTFCTAINWINHLPGYLAAMPAHILFFKAHLNTFWLKTPVYGWEIPHEPTVYQGSPLLLGQSSRLYTSAHVSISNLASNSSSTTTVDVLIVKHSFLAGKNRIGFPNMVQSHFFGLVKRRRRSILIYCWVKFCSTSEIAMDWTSFLNDDGYPNIKQALSFS